MPSTPFKPERWLPDGQVRDQDDASQFPETGIQLPWSFFQAEDGIRDHSR